MLRWVAGLVQERPDTLLQALGLCTLAAEKQISQRLHCCEVRKWDRELGVPPTLDSLPAPPVVRAQDSLVAAWSLLVVAIQAVLHVELEME